MIRNSFIYFLFVINVYASDLTLNPKFEKKIKSMVSSDVPFISIKDAKDKAGVIFVDAREKVEFDVSHIPNAIFAGYNDFDTAQFSSKLDKNKTYIIYCSVGYRSSLISKKLIDKGFKAFNLFGGIFEWVNQGNKVLAPNKIETKRVHTFNKDWSVWLDKGLATY